MADVRRQDIATAEKRVMSPTDAKEDMILVLEPHMNWQEMLCPAPLSVCLLGQLVLVTLDKDVSLVSELMDRSAFKYTKYPDSLRTSIVQVANQGWTSFNCANKNMDQIRLLTLQIPLHVKNAVKFIIGGSDEEIQELVPDILANIKRITDTCTSRAVEVEKIFTDVMNLIGELQEAFIFSKGEYGNMIRKAEKDIEVKSTRKEALEKRKQQAEKEYSEMREQFQKAQESYEKALDSMPSGWDMLGMDVVEELAKCTVTTVKNVTSMYMMKSLGGMPLVNNLVYEASVKSQRSTDALMLELPRISLCIQNILDNFSLLSQGKEPGDLTMVESTFNDIVTSLSSYSGACRDKFDGIKGDASQLIKTFKDASKQLSGGKQQIESAKGVAARLNAKMQGLKVFCETAFGAKPLEMPTPKMSTYEQGQSASASSRHSAQARFKVEQASSTLEAARSDFRERSEKLDKVSEDITAIITELARIKLDKVDFDQIKALLQRGIKAIGEVRTQWGKLVRFFQTISNIIKYSMNENVKTFLQSAEKGKKFRLKYTMSDMLRDMIYVQATDANTMAYMVNNLAEMYVEVSQKHLMDQVASLGELLALDPEKDKTAISRRQTELEAQAKDATASIARLVRQKKSEFDTKVKRRIQRIETEMKAVLPPPEPIDKEVEKEKRKAIQEAKELKAKLKAEDVDDWV
ncbi:myosin-11-like [Haliotis asinina]|uniref:myosin-11-like n=1 Tax=Haliotis asinina TaxID=109174 RepID=UPI0035324666